MDDTQGMNRRSFIKTSAAVAGSAILAAGAHGEAKRQNGEPKMPAISTKLSCGLPSSLSLGRP